jgi:hypothetical protein
MCLRIKIIEWPTIKDMAFPFAPPCLPEQHATNLYNKILTTKHITQNCNKKTTITKGINPWKNKLLTRKIMVSHYKRKMQAIENPSLLCFLNSFSYEISVR